MFQKFLHVHETTARSRANVSGDYEQFDMITDEALKKCGVQKNAEEACTRRLREDGEAAMTAQAVV